MVASRRMRQRHLLFITATMMLPSFYTLGQQDTIDRKRLKAVIVTSAVGYTATYVGLSQLWYENSSSQSFRFFNDNAEWKQVDKLGHFYSSFHFSRINAGTYRWAGVGKRRAAMIGALTGFLVIAPIEIFDGHSARYGASAGDLVADAAGPLFFIGQNYLWNEVRIMPKFSFHRTSFASNRPDVLGSDIANELLKDYNGQTYWLSIDMDKFTCFPKWLNVAVGYGAQGMLYARDAQNRENGYEPFRKYYLSLDFDLSAVRSHSKVVRTLIFLANSIRIPAPAFEFSRKRTVFWPVYH